MQSINTEVTYCETCGKPFDRKMRLTVTCDTCKSAQPVTPADILNCAEAIFDARVDCGGSSIETAYDAACRKLGIPTDWLDTYIWITGKMTAYAKSMGYIVHNNGFNDYTWTRK